MKQYLILITLLVFFDLAYGQDKNQENALKENIQKVELILPKDFSELIKYDNNRQDSIRIENNVELIIPKDLSDFIKAQLKEKEKSFLDKYGAVIVAIVALIGALITSLIGTYRSKKNLQNQIIANSRLEKEKKQLEIEHDKIKELKEMVATFIRSAAVLNLKFYEIIELINLGQNPQAHTRYADTKSIRDELIAYYYSIKVALDGSQKHLDLETVLNNYMNLVEFHFDINTISAVTFNQYIGQLYHKIKAIIHENYIEPV